MSIFLRTIPRNRQQSANQDITPESSSYVYGLNLEEKWQGTQAQQKMCDKNNKKRISCLIGQFLLKNIGQWIGKNPGQL